MRNIYISKSYIIQTFLFKQIKKIKAFTLKISKVLVWIDFKNSSQFPAK